MIDETIRPISHRQSVQQYEVYRQGRLAQIELEKKQEFGGFFIHHTFL
jgi:hypothetical protein